MLKGSVSVKSSKSQGSWDAQTNRETILPAQDLARDGERT